MKKTVGLLLAVILAISVCACTNGSEESSSTLPSSEAPSSSEASVPQTLGL
ncbi:hypothetical protein [Anaeromassilibacillus sp. SJQ-1]|uniref:hypothetical protein n=1 Tax=Anaeromassilibacillus sp. SJQ-1 TaxID=3375419 RepID=UPI003989726D